MIKLNVNWAEFKRAVIAKTFTVYKVVDDAEHVHLEDIVCGDGTGILICRLETADVSDYETNYDAGAVTVVNFDEAISKILF